jgi:predicted SnoaL-like aldol condensation-catalyzing enzyme
MKCFILSALAALAVSQAPPVAEQPCAVFEDLPPAVQQSPAELYHMQRETASTFSRAYAEKDIELMFSYIVDPYIQHNPNIRTGKDIAKTYLAGRLADPTIINNVTRVLSEPNYVFLRVHRTQEGVKDMVLADLYRLNGTCVTEHWDVIEEMDPDAPNPEAFF